MIPARGVPGVGRMPSCAPQNGGCAADLRRRMAELMPFCKGVDALRSSSVSDRASPALAVPRANRASSVKVCRSVVTRRGQCMRRECAARELSASGCFPQVTLDMRRRMAESWRKASLWQFASSGMPLAASASRYGVLNCASTAVRTFILWGSPGAGRRARRSFGYSARGCCVGRPVAGGSRPGAARLRAALGGPACFDQPSNERTDESAGRYDTYMP